MPSLCTSCGVEPAKPHMRVCRFCDTVGWRPAAPAVEPDEPGVPSRGWELLGTALLTLGAMLGWALLVEFDRVLH